MDLKRRVRALERAVAPAGGCDAWGRRLLQRSMRQPSPGGMPDGSARGQGSSNSRFGDGRPD